ncbi:MAG TPA: hypothetical protein VFY39_03685 [Gammaproteobacteria bacterium]|nr:hypothetical protein [Gammaproteobacteria bacterium]
MCADDRQTNDDVAFLRALAEGGISGAVRGGAILLAVGLIFGLVAAQYWAIDSGRLHVSPAARTWLWLDGLVPFLICLAVISRKFPGRSPGIASRSLAAAWSGMGAAFIAADAALIAASRTLGVPLLVKWMFPLVLFTLMGAAWGVAFAVRRRLVFGVVAGGCFVAAILCGAVMSRPQEWLVLSGGLILLVVAPGAMILRAGTRQH